MLDEFLKRPYAVRLECPVQHYDWGGREYIPALLGQPNPGRRPHAELWMGAHPRSSSIAVLDAKRMPLVDLIAAAPEACLGASRGRFGEALPYLFKVLDAGSMLSIQAHPSAEQARAGYAREDAAHIPVEAPERSYRDRNHKPEVHVALTDFWMLHGFRPIEELSRVLTETPEFRTVAPWFASKAERASGEPARRALVRELYDRCMRMPRAEADDILGRLLARLAAGPEPDPDSPDYWALDAAAAYPRANGSVDPGIFSIYLLNLIQLRPGEGTYQPAGTLHAYLRGVNVELMANSDNVLRGGLTAKHVDVEELLSTLTFDAGRPTVIGGACQGTNERVYRTPAEEFELTRIDLRPGDHVARPAHRGPDLLLALKGSVMLSAGQDRWLRRGDAAFVPDAVGYSVTAEDASELYRASVP